MSAGTGQAWTHSTVVYPVCVGELKECLYSLSLTILLSFFNTSKSVNAFNPAQMSLFTHQVPILTCADLCLKQLLQHIQ